MVQCSSALLHTTGSVWCSYVALGSAGCRYRWVTVWCSVAVLCYTLQVLCGAAELCCVIQHTYHFCVVQLSCAV